MERGSKKVERGGGEKQPISPEGWENMKKAVDRLSNEQLGELLNLAEARKTLLSHYAESSQEGFEQFQEDYEDLLDFLREKATRDPRVIGSMQPKLAYSEDRGLNLDFEGLDGNGLVDLLIIVYPEGLPPYIHQWNLQPAYGNKNDKAGPRTWAGSTIKNNPPGIDKFMPSKVVVVAGYDSFRISEQEANKGTSTGNLPERLKNGLEGGFGLWELTVDPEAYKA